MGRPAISAARSRRVRPFELFLSADEAYVLALAREGYAVDDGVPYAIGRLALVVPEGSTLKLDPTLRDLARRRRRRSPPQVRDRKSEHAPYGRAAQEALSSAGVWEAIAAHLVLGENVAQAAQFATVGFGARRHRRAVTRARARRAGVGAARPDSRHMHRPLVQRMALTKRAAEGAREFYRYLSSRRRAQCSVATASRCAGE